MKTPGTAVLDVRTPAEYTSGHLPQARNINIESSDFSTRIAALDKNATYARHCRSGNRPDAALEQMSAAGFTHVYDLVGGDRRLAGHGQADGNGRVLTGVTYPLGCTGPLALGPDENAF